MRVLFISQYFFPEQVSNNRICEHLASVGHEVSVYTAVPNYPTGRFFEGFSNRLRRAETWGKIRIKRAWTVPRGKRAVQLMINYAVFPITASLALLRGREKPDVVFVSQLSPVFMTFPGIVQKWRTRAPLIYWVQDIWPESATFTLGIRNRLAVKALNRVCGWLYRRADIVMVQSAAFRDMIARFGVPPDRIRVLPNTAPENYVPLSPQQAPEYADRIPPSGFRLMFAGNIGESQDFDTLIAAAALLRERKDLHWLIVGSGRDEERVKRLVADSGLADRFRFLGRHPEEDMPKFFAHADAMIVSLKDFPIFALTVPYKVQCYMACGKPIVASLNGEGARIVRESGAGPAVAASRPDLLAAAISEMMDVGERRRQEYAANSRAYFEANYSAAKVYGDLERALNDAASMAKR